jgi:hypothetical protein
MVVLSEAVLANLRCQAALCGRIAGLANAADAAHEWRALGAEIDALVRAHLPPGAPRAEAPASAPAAPAGGKVVRLVPLT